MQENLLKEILNPITIIIILMGENCINVICNHETHGHEHEEGAIIKPTSVNLITWRANLRSQQQIQIPDKSYNKILIRFTTDLRS